MVRVAAYAGLRQGELLALRWRDVDSAGSVLTIARAMSAGVKSSTKSGRIRRVPLADRFARSLQAQTAYAVARGAHTADYAEMLRENLTSNRALQRHNAQPNSIKEVFARFGLDIWRRVDEERSGNDERREKLWALITWRNAIAHDDIEAKLANNALEPVAISSERVEAGAAR